MIDKLVENRGKTNERCLSVLGSTARVKTLASIWEKNAQLFEMIALDGLLKYAQEEVFTEKEFEAYRAGIAHVGAFMAECVAESTEKIVKTNDF
jgi:hypothetical protein